MKVLILTTTFPKDKEDYSTPRFVYDIALNLSIAGLNIHILTPDRPDCTVPFEKISENFVIQRFQYFTKNKQKLTTGEGIIPSLKQSRINYILIPFLIIKQFFSTVKLIRKNKIDIINSHWLVPSGLIGAIIQKIWKRKNFVTVHAAALYMLERIPFGKQITRFIFKNSVRFFIVSNYGKERFTKLLDYNDEKISQQKVKIISMGVYCNNFLLNSRKKAFDDNKFNILFLGRIVDKKGLIYAIQAIETLKEQNIIFHVCGSGALQKDLENLVKELSLDQSIIFHGRISEEIKIDYLNSADVLLVPSIETEEGDKEGLPVVILEALAAGLPIIASDIGGIKDGVIPNKTGILVHPKDIKQIAEAINLLYKNKEMKRQMSKWCIEYSKNFDWKVIANKYLREIKASFED